MQAGSITAEMEMEFPPLCIAKSKTFSKGWNATSFADFILNASSFLGLMPGGRPGPDSDIDLLIVMDVDGSTRKKANEIDLLMADREGKVIYEWAADNP